MTRRHVGSAWHGSPPGSVRWLMAAPRIRFKTLCVYIYVCVLYIWGLSLCVCVCLSVCLSMYVCLYVCMSVCMECMHVCMYVMYVMYVMYGTVQYGTVWYGIREVVCHIDSWDSYPKFSKQGVKLNDIRMKDHYASMCQKSAAILRRASGAPTSRKCTTNQTGFYIFYPLNH